MVYHQYQIDASHADTGGGSRRGCRCDGDNALATMNVGDGAAVGYGGRQLGHGDVDGGVMSV